MARGDPIGVAAECHLGAYVCAKHELRITQRCLRHDLGLGTESEFSASLAKPIVKAFAAKRLDVAGDGETIGPAAGSRSLYKLRSQHRHRGATWHDAVEDVVWLCAAGYHTSGDPDDAYKQFAKLLEAHEIEPTADDYLQLGRERRRRFVDLLSAHAEQAVAASMAEPAAPIPVLFGRHVPVRIACRPEGDLIEVRAFVAASVLNASEARVLEILAALGGMPDSPWEIVDANAVGSEPEEVGFMTYRAAVQAATR